MTDDPSEYDELCDRIAEITTGLVVGEGEDAEEPTLSDRLAFLRQCVTNADASRLPVDREKLRLALCASLAWGRVYGAVIPKHQWEEMRDQQVEQHVVELSKP